MISDGSSPTAATPILVVGMNRSGTKWLSNILCNHSSVFGALADRHTGIIETNLFGKMQNLLGEIDRIEHFVAFVEMWTQTDFFSATGIEKEFVYRAAHRPPRSILSVFCLVMNEAARRRGARYWLQKTSPAEGLEVLPQIREAKVVTIQRGLVPTLESGSKLRQDRGEREPLIKSAATYAHEARLLRRISREFGAVHVDYESLRREPALEIRRVCEAIGLDFQPQMLESRFRPNTSFRATERRDSVLGPSKVRLARCVAALVTASPLPLTTWVRQGLAKRRAVLVTGTFSAIVERYALR